MDAESRKEVKELNKVIKDIKKDNESLSKDIKGLNDNLKVIDGNINKLEAQKTIIKEIYHRIKSIGTGGKIACPIASSKKLAGFFGSIPKQLGSSSMLVNKMANFPSSIFDISRKIPTA